MSKEIKSTELIAQEQAEITESTTDIRSMIHIVRGQQVMVDYDFVIFTFLDDICIIRKDSWEVLP